MRPLPDGLDALVAGGKPALARCLSTLETAPDDPGLAALLDAAAARPRGIALGLTGPPGVGKSTLSRALVGCMRDAGRTVGVIAVDPSSRRSGGALLGDRTRIAADPGDSGTFVRSMAARDRLGGLADITLPATVLMRAIYDWVLIETVGIGQSESEIADCADLVVLCVQPGSGDALQFMKAGIMEVPDLVLVTKGDLGAPARRAEADVIGALSLADGGTPAATTVVSARTGEGLDAALELLEARAGRLGDAGDLAARRAAQTRHWMESRLADSLGKLLLDALRPRFEAADTGFFTMATLREDARRAIDEIVKNV